MERQPLTVWIQSRQAYDYIQFSSNTGSPYLKDPRSKTLEPDCLSPHAFDCDIASQGGRSVRTGTVVVPTLATEVREGVILRNNEFCHGHWGGGSKLGLLICNSRLALDLMISERNKQKGRAISHPALVLAKLNIQLLFNILPKL